MSTISNKRRRSSFIRGRRSKTYFQGVPVVVPSGLSEDEQQVYMSVEKTFRRLCAELSDSNELQQFVILARNRVTNNLYEERCTHSVPHMRDNEATELKTKKLPMYAARLKKEGNCWQDLIQLHTDLPSQGAQFETDEQRVEMTDKSLLITRPDYEMIVQQVEDMSRASLILKKNLETDILKLFQYWESEKSLLLQESYNIYDCTADRQEDIFKCVLLQVNGSDSGVDMESYS